MSLKLTISYAKFSLVNSSLKNVISQSLDISGAFFSLAKISTSYLHQREIIY